MIVYPDTSDARRASGNWSGAINVIFRFVVEEEKKFVCRMWRARLDFARFL